jgi:hypothetical protein
LLWPVLLVAVSAVGSLAFACVTPFAALGVVAAWVLSARAALLTVVSIWLANQLIGFAVLGYPWTIDSALWGLAIGAAALAATALACATVRLASRNVAVALGLALVVAFGGYEAGLFLMTFWLGGEETFTLAIIGRLALLNLGWTFALVGVRQILRHAGAIAPNLAGAGARTVL